MNMKQVTACVHAELRSNEAARKNDNALIIGVLHRLGIDTSVPFDQLVMNLHRPNFESITRARRKVQEEFPERKLMHIDTLCASVGQGLLVYHASKLRDAGATIQEVFEQIMAMKDYIHHLVTVDDLFFLKRGGRLSAVSAIAGSMLKVKPIILVNEDGRLNNVATVRGRKNALKDLYERMKGNQCFDKLGYVFISHADCMEDAETLATMVREEYPAVEVVISDIGPVIGAHTGPGGIALCFLGNTIKGE